MAEISLEKSIIDGLTSRGVLAYVAVKMCWGMEVTTAVLADQVRCQSAAMLEGLQDLELAAPGMIRRNKKKWTCGNVPQGAQIVSLTSSRFHTFVDDLKKYWDYLTTPKGGSPAPFAITAKDGAAINRFLKDYSAWGQAEWRAALRNRIASVVDHQQAPRTQPFHEWIPKLANYEAGPLDRFNKPVEGSERHGKVHSIQQGNRAAGSEFLDRVRARTQGGIDSAVRDEVRPDREPDRNNGTA